jgi:hypothetical protein
MLSYNADVVSVEGTNAILFLDCPPFPKELNIKMKTMGKRILKTMALGLLKIALKLALVIAHKALGWLYGCAIPVI